MKTAAERRAPLLAHMHALAAEGKHCGGCIGVCCTSRANSMRITEAEARDILDFLEREERVNDQLRDDLRACVRKFDLDSDLGDGRRVFSRRTYTCPFFLRGETGRGCSIAPESKPYGCLAFNAREPGITEGGNCRSNQSLLAEVEAETGVADTEERWPIPVAVLRVLDALDA